MSSFLTDGQKMDGTSGKHIMVSLPRIFAGVKAPGSENLKPH